MIVTRNCTHMAKRVLILTYYYYPYNTPGSLRAGKTAKYLPKYGWEPVVLCPEWTPENSLGCYDPAFDGNDPCETVRVPNVLFSGERHPILARAQYHLNKAIPTHFPWQLHRRMLARASELAKRQSFDVIFATLPRPMATTVAKAIKQEHKIPYVADFRDVIDQQPLEHKWYFRFLGKMETRSCNNADALITVTQHLADMLADRHSVPIHVIPNGFDPPDFPPVENNGSEYFDIVYCGSLYPGRDPSPLFDAVDGILRAGTHDISRLRISFYGVPEIVLNPFVEGRPCAKHVHNMGRVPFEESVRIEQQAAVLMLLSHRAKGIMTSKVFEYLAIRRPVLSIPGDFDATDTLLQETQAGVAGRTVEQVTKIVLDWYAEWEKTGKLRYYGLPDKIAQYTRETQTQRIAEVLESVCDK